MHFLKLHLWSLIAILAFSGLGTEEGRAQAPTSIAGTAVILTIQSGTAPYFASSGSYRFLGSATDSSFGVIAISGNVADSYGTITSYAHNGATGTVNFTDSGVGVPAVCALTFSTASTGTFTTTIPSAPGASQTGTFSVYNGTGPASVLGWKFNLHVDYGVSPFASGGGTAQLLPATTGNSYQIVGGSGVSNSSGTYSYNLVSTSASSLLLNDSVLGPTYTQTLSWNTSTSGAYVARNSSGGFQAGTFTATPAYAVTPSAGSNGSISPNGVQIVSNGGSTTFTANPNAGYAVSQWLVNGIVSQAGGTTYSASNVTAATTVQVTFSLVTPYTTTSSNGQITITGYTGPGGALIIPSTINSLPVISIGASAFYNTTSLTSVIIPSSVTSIGASAFQYCTNLTNVTIPSSVTSIGQSAFYSCGSLTSVTIPTSVTSIGQSVFYDCIGLTSMTIPASVTSIGQDAFMFCDGLISVTIPNSVTNIGDYAFSNCTSLTTVTIPGSVTSIGQSVFSGCTSLSSATISFGGTIIGNFEFSGCSGLTSVTIPNGVSSIGSNAFGSCTNLASVTIPTTVTTIGFEAFFFCTSLTSVTIPSSVSSVGQSAFAFCSKLTGAVFKGNAPTMGSGAFSSPASGFSVYYSTGATGFASPTWTDSSGDQYPAIQLKTSQSITFPAIATQVYPSASFNLVATASSGLPVTFNLVSGPATLAGSTLTLTGVGMVVVQASQAGNSNFGAATTVSQSFTVAQIVPLATWEGTNVITDLTATPEKDGVPNLLKYLYDIDPATTMSTTDRSALPTVGIDSTTTINTEYLAITYRQYALASGVSVHFQTSTDLQTWRTITPGVDQQVGVDPSTGDPIVEMGVPITGSNQYIRLNVTSP